MDEIKEKHDLVKASQILSTVFSPIIIPTYCTMIAMWVTPLSILPESIRFIATLVVFGLTALLPTLIIVLLMRMGKVSNLDISNRRQRLLPLMLVLVCYVFCAWYMHHSHAFWWLVMYYVSGCVTNIVVAIISLKWKISAHGAGMGNMAGMLAALMAGGYSLVNMLPWLCTAIILAGVVGSARVILHRHTVAQVVAGILVSMVITAMLMTMPVFANMYN